MFSVQYNMTAIIVCVYLMITVQLKDIPKKSENAYLSGIDPTSPLPQVYKSIHLDHFHLAICILRRHVSDTTLFKKSQQFKLVRHLSLVPGMW